MKKGIMLIDVARCHGCNNCFMACKDEFVGNDFPPYSVSQPRHGQKWIRLEKTERGQYPMIDVSYLPIPCQHCQEPACQKAGEDAVFFHESGAVVFHCLSAREKKALADSCPYHVVYWNEAANLAQKCNLCSHLLDDGWQNPRCVMACPTEALTFHWLEESEVSVFLNSCNAQPLHPEFNTKPRVYYKNLYRCFSHFIGGSITLDNECLEGALVTCLDEDGIQRGKVRTNTFGKVYTRNRTFPILTAEQA